MPLKNLALSLLVLLLFPGAHGVTRSKAALSACGRSLLASDEARLDDLLPEGLSKQDRGIVQELLGPEPEDDSVEFMRKILTSFAADKRAAYLHLLQNFEVAGSRFYQFTRVMGWDAQFGYDVITNLNSSIELDLFNEVFRPEGIKFSNPLGAGGGYGRQVTLH